MKKTFVKLRNLLDISYEGETKEDNARWVLNVLDSVGDDAYFVDDGDGTEYITKELGADEVEFVDLNCYFFMGSAYEQERFYPVDFVCVEEKATGDYYALETEQIREGAY